MLFAFYPGYGETIVTGDLVARRHRELERIVAGVRPECLFYFTVNALMGSREVRDE
jgi:hypothetical protein